MLRGFKGDDFTKFYIGWLELYSFAESDFDDTAKFSRIELPINVQDLFTHDIFISQSTLADQTISFMQELTEAIAQTNHCVAIITLPASPQEVGNTVQAHQIRVRSRLSAILNYSITLSLRLS